MPAQSRTSSRQCSSVLLSQVVFKANLTSWSCRLFYDACSAPAWQVAVSDAGHFQFLDAQSTMQRAICATGRASDADVRATAQASITLLPSYGEGCKLGLAALAQLQCITVHVSDMQAVMVTWGELMARKDIRKDQLIPALRQAADCIAVSGTDSSYKNL